jgi:ferritin-like protein
VDELSKTRTERARALEEWAERVDQSDLKEADTSALRSIAELADKREDVEAELAAAVQAARNANRSWSEIGAMLGVSKQAAQRKYSSKMTLGR